MIHIDPSVHMTFVSQIIRSKGIVLIIFVYALTLYASGGGFISLQSLVELMLTGIIFLFTPYLLFVLWINDKTVWATGLLIWMATAFVFYYIDSGNEILAFLFEQFPFLFLVLFCFFLNMKLPDWGFGRDDSSKFWRGLR